MYFKFFFKKIQSYELLVLGLCTRNVPRSRVPLITGILKEHTVPLSAWGRMHSHVKTGLLVFFFFGGTMKKSYSANLRLYSKTVKDGPCVTFSKTLFGWSRRGCTAVLCCLSLGLTI